MIMKWLKLILVRMSKNIVTVSFSTTVKQMTEIFSDQNVLAKYDWNILVKKNPAYKLNIQYSAVWLE